MSPYCSAHDEWLIMKLCMNVRYHDANHVSNFGGDPVNQLNFLNVLQYYLRCFTDMALHSRVPFGHFHLHPTCNDIISSI